MNEPLTRSAAEDIVGRAVGQLELRFRDYMDAHFRQLKEEIRQDIQEPLEAFGQGKFTPAQIVAIDERIKDNGARRDKSAWTHKQRIYATVGACLGIITFLISSSYTIIAIINT